VDTIEEEKLIQARPGRKRKPEDQLKGRRRLIEIPDNHVEFEAREMKIPKRFEAIFMLIQDGRSPTGAVLTRAELDEIPETKLLPKAEKDAIARYWVHWQNSYQHVRAVAQLRKDEIAITTNAYKVAEVLRRKGDFDSLSLPDQMKVTAAVLDKQIQDAALVHAATSLHEIHTDELSLAVYKQRVNFIKDAFWIRNNIFDLSERLKQAEKNMIEDGELVDETEKLLEVAAESLRGRGIR
jgi:hypothetical protein